MADQLDALVAQGRSALSACDWARARACLEEAALIEETAEVLDGLGQARYWQGDYADAIALREQAYTRYRERGDHPRAAFVAYQVAMLHGLVYGNGAALNGWLGHARRMLEDCGDCPERGWVELFRAAIASDPRERERRARTAMDAGRRFGDPGLEFDAMSYLGKALVEQGTVQEGMALIDEAVAATHGVVTDPWAAGEIYCALFHACEMAVDVKRAEGWLDAVAVYVARTGELPISGICRMHYGGVLTAAGRWADAEEELSAALDICRATYQGTRSEVLLRLAELRARQGRLDEARGLLRGHEDHPEGAPVRIRLHLADGDTELAQAVAERHLARRGRGLTSAPVLALLVEARLAAGTPEDADTTARELETLADACDQAAARGLAALCRARVADAAGHDTAAGHYERALAAFQEAALPYELARARLGLATCLITAKPTVARAEARAALNGFQELGAARDADEAASLLRRLGDRARSWPRQAGVLTKREAEVLDLLGQGLTNAAIAERLFISPRTAEHHVGSVLAKLGLANRAEASAYALRHATAAGQVPRR